MRAVKVVYCSKFSDAHVWQRELEGVKQFDRVCHKHQGLVAVLHVGISDKDGEYFFYVMELADSAGAAKEGANFCEHYRPLTLAAKLQESGSSTLSVGNLKDASSFAEKLKAPPDCVSAYIRGRLNETTRRSLETWCGKGLPPESLQRALIGDLNEIIEGASIWDDDGRFTLAKVAIRPETRELLQSSPVGSELALLNRLLVEDTYPQELSRNRRMREEECIKTAIALAKALGHLHLNGLIHRDIKPSNIVFVNGSAKLADPGTVTRTDGTVSYVGTEGYIPPEGPGTVQGDIYSLGKVLYVMATGRDPKAFPSWPPELIPVPEPVAMLREHLRLVINKACDPKPEKRHLGAADIVLDLEAAGSSGSLPGRRLNEVSWSRIRWLLKLGWRGAFGVVLMTVVAIGFLPLVPVDRGFPLAPTQSANLLDEGLWKASTGVELGRKASGGLEARATGEGEQCAVMNNPVAVTTSSVCTIRCGSLDGAILVQRYFYDAAGNYLNNDGKKAEARVDSTEPVTIHLLDGETPPQAAKVALKLWLEGNSPRAIIAQFAIRHVVSAHWESSPIPFECDGTWLRMQLGLNSSGADGLMPKVPFPVAWGAGLVVGQLRLTNCSLRVQILWFSSAAQDGYISALARSSAAKATDLSRDSPAQLVRVVAPTSDELGQIPRPLFWAPKFFLNRDVRELPSTAEAEVYVREKVPVWSWIAQVGWRRP